MAGWSAALFAIVRADYVNFRLARFDLGNMVQAVWSTAHGRPLEVTVTTTGEQVERLALHVDPILALLAPLWLVAPSPLTLAGVQIAACALGALPVFWLGRRHLGSERTAAVLALAYLAYPWLGWSALNAMHPATLAIPLLLFCVWFLDGDRLWPFVACAVLAAMCGELIGVAVAALGIWHWLAHGRPRSGLTIAAAGLAWSAFAVKVVVPAFADGPSVFYGHYESIGGSPEGVLKTAFTDPWAILSTLFTGSDVRYVVLLSLPLLGLFLLAPGLAAVAVPRLLVNGLSETAGPDRTALPLRRRDRAVRRRGDRLGHRAPRSRRKSGRREPRTRLVPPLRRSLRPVARHAFEVRASPLVRGCTGPRRSPARSRGARSRRRARQHDEQRRLAPLGAQVSREFAPLVGRAEWIVIDTVDPYMAAHPGVRRAPDMLAAFRQRVEQSQKWTKVYERAGVLVFQKVPPGSS